MAQRIEIGAEAQGPARAQYDAGVSLEVIARSLGFSSSTLKRRIKELGWPARRPCQRIAPAPLKLAPPDRTDAAPRGGFAPEMIAARVQDAVERQLAGVERILARLGPAKLDEVECGARTLATLARTLRELMQLRPKGSSSGGADDEPEIRDLDEFRRDLSRRLDRLVADAKAASPDPVEG